MGNEKGTAKVYVSLKNGVHDPQGVAIKNALKSLGFDSVEDVRAGKYFEVKLGTGGGDAKEQVRRMCENLLANTVIEDYRIELP